jgi:hypothetical protein
MTDHDIGAIVAELRRQHPRTVTDGDLTDLEHTLRILPDRGQWKIAEKTAAIFALVPGDKLFTVMVERPSAPGESCPVSMSARAIDGHKLAARFDWGERVDTRDGELWRRTHWVFRYSHQRDDELEEWQRATGSVRMSPQPEELDAEERYARALLSEAGRVVARVEGEDVRPVWPRRGTP